MSSIKTVPPQINLDAALKDLGQFGRFQVYYFILLLFPVVLTSFRLMEYVFTTVNPAHRCRVPECDSNSTTEFSPPWLPSALPLDENLDPLPCLRYLRRDDTLEYNLCSADMFTNVTETCHSWVFKDPVRTVANDFDIMCPGDYWMLTFISSISVFTGFVGEPLTGIISDRFGRKKVLVYGSIYICVAGLLRSFSPNYVMLALIEGIDGLISGALFSPAYLLGLETLSVKKRLLGSMLINMYWPFGEVVLGLTMWAVQDWRVLQRVFYAPMLIICIILYWLLPESVRWLHTMGKHHELCELLEKIAKLNKTEAFLPQIINQLQHPIDVPGSKKENTEPDKTLRLQAVLKSRIMTWRVITFSLLWIVNIYTLNGISQSSVIYFKGNQYLSFILVSIVEIPAYLVSLWIPAWHWMGRRGTLAASLVLAGLACLAMTLLSPDKTDLNLMFFLLGKFFSSITITVLTLYTAEVFPTELRHSLLAFCSMSGRIGVISAQQTPLLEGLVSPMLLVGLVSLIGGLLVLTCPETLGTHLPDTLEEAENIGRRQRIQGSLQQNKSTFLMLRRKE